MCDDVLVHAIVLTVLQDLRVSLYTGDRPDNSYCSDWGLVVTPVSQIQEGPS